MGSSPFSAMSIFSLVSYLFLLSLPSLPKSSVAAIADHGDWFLSPNFPPLFNSCAVMNCGKGRCRSSDQNLMGFVCECDAGWTQLHNRSHFRFLPCVIPNCNFDLNCSNSSSALAPIAPPPDDDDHHSSLEPCDWAFCGEGSCKKTGHFNHDCECKQGYSNLFNISTFPCFTECALEGECRQIGVALSNQTSNSSRPSLPDSSGSNNGAHHVMLHGSLFSSTVLIASLAIFMWTF